MPLTILLVAPLLIAGGRARPQESPAPRPVLSTRSYSKPAEADLKSRLTPLQYEVTQQGGTEPAFRNVYWDNHADGLYADVATGEPLFSSTDKFESGTGWPSFTRPIEPGRVVEHADSSHGVTVREVRSQGGASHLGHVFDDGPGPTGLRYCINSAALRFIPATRLEAEGYAEYRTLFMPQETAILAGGCFWGLEQILREIPGVIETEVGYTGGTSAKPSYAIVSRGGSGHAEAVRIVFDPTKLTYTELLERWFFRMHDPTTRDRQGNDVGSQYRSAIFYTTPAQRKTAEELKARVAASGKWKQPIVTEVVEASPFTRAEDMHQDYLRKNPGGYTCHYLRD